MCITLSDGALSVKISQVREQQGRGQAEVMLDTYLPWLSAVSNRLRAILKARRISLFPYYHCSQQGFLLLVCYCAALELETD